MKPIRLTLCSKCVDEIGWPKSKKEPNGTQGDGDGHKVMIKCSNMEKKKDKNKMRGLKAKVYAMAFCFADQDAKECVIMFRIYSCTIKRGTLMVNTVIKWH
jgi:translation elongation factor EF-G